LSCQANIFCSYGGHYGPAFYNYFYKQNQAIKNGSTKGVQLQMDTLGVINGIVDEEIQAPYYPEFAMNNTYGIKAVNESVYFAMVSFYADSPFSRAYVLI
jgi:carboxypeptidase C (cathepsin A)